MNGQTPRVRNYSALFSLFKKDKKDRLTIILQNIGIVLFSVMFGLRIIWSVFYDYFSEPKHNNLETAVAGGIALGLFGGMFCFIGVGARVMGQHAGVKGMWQQLARILWKTFLYLLLPCLVFVLLLVAYFHFFVKNSAL